MDARRSSNGLLPLRFAVRPSLRSLALFLHLILAILFTKALEAQTPGVSGISVAIARISAEQDLSSNQVYAIVQDKQGFIWIGTEYGLNRFDGRSFTIYMSNPNDSTSLSHNLIRSVFADRMGTLWVGTQHGLNRFDPESRTFKRFFHDPRDVTSLSNDEVRSFYEDRSGVFWVGTARGLNRFERATETWTRFLPTPNDSARPGDNFVNAILEDRHGSFWIGTGGFLVNGGGLHKLNRENNSFSHYSYNPSDSKSLSSNWVTSLLEDRSGTLWITVDSGDVNTLDTATGNFEHLRMPDDEPANASLGAHSIKCIREDNMGALWIATWGRGLFRYDKQAGTFTRYTYDPSNPTSLSNPAINTLFVDRAGLLWVGTDRGGVNTVATRPFLHRHMLGNSLRIGSRVDGLYADRRGSLWVGAVGAGLWRFDPAMQRSTRVLPDLANEICEDSAGLFWISTLDAVIKHDRRTGSSVVVWRVPVRHGGEEWISRMLFDSRGNLWIGTTGSLYRLVGDMKEPSVFVHDPQDRHSMTAGQVNSILEDRSGNIWVGTAEGLNRFNRETQSFTRFAHDENDSSSLSNDYWCTIFKDRYGALWVGTADGLNRFDESNSSFSRFYPAEQRRSRFVNRILEDARGRFWYASGAGVTMFDPSTGSFTFFNESEGIEQADVLGWSCTRLPSGEMLFGTANGILVFHPDSVRTSGYIPPVVITGVKKFNQAVSLASQPEALREIAFTHEENVFSIEYAALSYDIPAFNHYAYKLEGFDRDWVYCGNKREATYTNLDPGSYTFHVKGSNHSGVWNEIGTSVAVIITPPWWKTWWFTILFWLTIAGSIGAAVRYVETKKLKKRIQQLEQERAIVQERDRTRDRIASDLHDDVASTLGSIALYTESLNRGLRDSSKPMSELMQRISALLNEAQDAVGDIVWSVTPRHDTLQDLLWRMKDLASDLCSTNGIACSVVAPKDMDVVPLPERLRKSVYLIFKEALNNIIKHAQAKSVSMRVEIVNGMFEMVIQDDGVGFSTDAATRESGTDDHPTRGHGLKNMTTRAEEMGGRLSIHSTPGKGTTLHLSVSMT